MGQRKDTTVNRSLGVEEYKRLTLGETKTSETPAISDQAPVIMASNAPAPSTTPEATPATPVQAEPMATNTPAAPAEVKTETSDSAKMASESPAQ
tara:strand:- start:89 stop:373 length:285 start_codon:yes stop_codon:yes gene_type:complete